VTTADEHDQEREPDAEPTPEPAAEPGAEPADEPDHDIDNGDAGDEPEPEPERPGTEQLLREQSKKLDKETKRHVTALGNILGDSAVDTLPCPLCFGGLQGFVYPQDAASLSDEARMAALSFLGLGAPLEDEPPPLKEAEGVVMCDRCDGWGKLVYPTRNPHVETQNCPKCSGQGYVAQPAAPTNVQPLPTSYVPTTSSSAATAGACPLCGAPGMAGQPHWCAPPQAVGG